MELVQIAQHADDLQRAADFYELLLDEKPIARFDPPGLVFFRLGRTRLLLDRVAPSALLYIGVQDVRTRIDELADHGVTIHTQPHLIFSHEDETLGPAGHDEWQAFIKDSEGNLVGLVSHYAS
ncbi:MAG: VOC family protein [Nocardioidaceae bacterium]